MLSLHASTAVTARTSTDAQLSGRRATSTSTARARVASRRHAMPTRMVFTPVRISLPGAGPLLQKSGGPRVRLNHTGRASIRRIARRRER
jgi:hypothetical protein